MIRDPVYREIEERLDGKLDPELFERCAVDLLRPAYPGLSSVRGGGDAGMDGSIPTSEGPPTPLVCTTGKDVIGNLTRSLRSYVAEAGGSRSAVVATSQALTPLRRRNLEERAYELGFTLLNVHAQDDFVSRLYQEPEWRKELLGLTGEPPALSALPRSRRPFAAQPLIGRDADVAWLESQLADCLISGQPGSGKTAVLAHCALAGEGAFLISDVRGEIADAIREQSPQRIFIDDAHRRHDLLVELRALRTELDANFSIVATCWPAATERIQRSLEVPPDGVRQLLRLPRTEMAQIVKAVGVYGPEALVAEILDQAAGLPGLAVTLTQLCIRAGTEELARGDFLLGDVNSTLRELVGEGAIPILAAFSVGGRTGFGLVDVARALDLPPADVWDAVTRIEAGGVLREISQGALAVEPSALREALVRKVFFSGSLRLPIANLLTTTPSPANSAKTLIRAGARGAEVPDILIRDLLERCVPDEYLSGQGNEEAWVHYAYSGAESVDWILDRYPPLLKVIARPALMYRAGRVIPLLLTEAVGDQREMNRYPRHPLRLIQDWIQAGRPGTGEALSRRRALLDAVRAWRSQPESDPHTLKMAIAIAFSPEFSISPADRIDPRKIHLVRGHLTGEEYMALHGWWPEAVEMLETIGIDDVGPIEHMVHQWSFPGMLQGVPTEEATVAAKAGAAKMLEDLARLAEGFPGVVAWAERLADQAGLDVHLPALDPVYEVLFPHEAYSEDWKMREERQVAAARELATKWMDKSPEDVAEMLVRYDREGARTERSWPRLTDIVAAVLAEGIDDRPLPWIDALVREGAEPDLVAPFMWRMLERGDEQAEPVWKQLFELETYRYLCLSVALRSVRATEAMLEQTLANLDEVDRLVKVACLRNEIPPKRLSSLLEHPSAAVSAAAAEGMWHTRQTGGSVPEKLRPAWRTAVVRHVRSDHILREVFRSDSDLARDWLLARRGESGHSQFGEGVAFAHAVAVLDTATRRELIEKLDGDFGPPGFFKTLVGGDPSLFDVLLGRPDLGQAQLEPFEGRPDSVWIELAKRALDAGYSVDDLVHACHQRGWTWTGNVSLMWDGFAESFRTLEEHEDERIREIGRIGRELSEAQADIERAREHQEEVYGLR